MDANTPSFSNRSNAKRAADAKLANETAPAAEYELRTRDDGRTEIVWKTASVASASMDKGELNGHDTTGPLLSIASDPRDATRTATIEPAVSADRPTVNREPAKKSRRGAADGALSKGPMIQKPVITSKTNQHYQRRFDRLAALAAVGDWDAVRAYQIKGSNTYSKMLERYRRQLLASHEASNIAR